MMLLPANPYLVTHPDPLLYVVRLMWYRYTSNTSISYGNNFHVTVDLSFKIRSK